MDQETRVTQCDMILAYMRQHGGITQGEAWNMGIARLASRINNLRNRGYAIKTIPVTKRVKRYGKIKVIRFARYELEAV